MTQKIKKILIANRGEIACRVIRTARKMGIATVAVYSDADRKALHVRMADEAVHIGPSPAIESYLVIEKIIAAAKETGADAIHPGYGFLSENPDFVRACEKAKITFIGPSAEAMEAMGLKDAAKKLMDEAGVPITPGYHGKDQSPELLKTKAGDIGYPVLIKAVAGGGGKGMRKVEDEADFDAALASCQREAASSFGNEDVLIEKYIQSPRHIEVQVFGDTHGNVVHMFERDCSLQRRHQKVIEEAPAPGMTDAVRKAMTSAAINAAKAVDYVGAGTVEFIVDGSGKLREDGFWFMEMNTRLQVEHPVTEEITGLDLVEWQIRVARGEKLPKQDEIMMNGHAVEARIYAEDPANDFLPSAGKVDFLRIPKLGLKRFDSGIDQGGVVGIHYDPMIGKAIAHEANREDAITKLRRGLSLLGIWPLKTNVAFLYNLLRLNDFQSGDMTTHSIVQNLDLVIEACEDNPDERLAQIAKFALEKLLDSKESAGSGPFDFSENGYRKAWRLSRPHRTSQTLFINDIATSVSLDQTHNDWTMSVDGQHYAFHPKAHGKALNKSYFPTVTVGNKDSFFILQNGHVFHVSSSAPDNYGSETASSDTLTAPMPGKIIALNCAAGDSVSEGDPLVVMEAMKMEQTLTAPRDGVVAEIGAAVGELVTDGALLVRLEEVEE